MKIYLGSVKLKKYILIIKRNDGVIRAHERELTRAKYLSLKQLEGMKKEGTNYSVVSISEL